MPPLAFETRNLELIGILVELSVVFSILAAYTFRWCDFRAREKGLIDRVTNY